MKTKINKGATLLITTITLSVVAITSAAFSGVYFRYGKMNSDFNNEDREKIELRNDINIAYEHFLKDTSIEILNETKKLRSEWILSEPGLEYQSTLSVPLSNFIANFRCERVDKSLIGLYVVGNTYTINSKIELKDDLYSLTYINYERRGN